MKSLLLCLFYAVSFVASGVNKQKMRETLKNRMDEEARFHFNSFQRAFLPPDNAREKRGFCETASDIEPCNGCSILGKWQTEDTFFYNDDELDYFERVVVTTVLNFFDNYTYIARSESEFFLSEQIGLFPSILS